MDATPPPAESHRDYRFFRFLAGFGAKLTIAGLVFTAWRLLWYRDPFSDTVAFLLSTTILALMTSLVAGFVAYYLFKRRGGRVEKSEPPPLAPQPPNS